MARFHRWLVGRYAVAIGVEVSDSEVYADLIVAHPDAPAAASLYDPATRSHVASVSLPHDMPTPGF